jgi:hypothetical protein
MARNNDRRRISENYEPPFDAAGYKPGSPKMKRIEGSGSGVVGGERRQLKGGHGGTEQTHPKNRNRVNDKGVVTGSETSSSHGEASDGFQERVGHDWPDGPENDGASSEFITGYDYTGAAPEPTLEGWNPASIGSMIGEEYNLQDMFNQYAGTRRSVNMLEFKNVCRANGFDYPLSEDMFRQLIENNREFIFTEHHDGTHRFYISESDMGGGMDTGEQLAPIPDSFKLEKDKTNGMGGDMGMGQGVYLNNGLNADEFKKFHNIPPTEEGEEQQIDGEEEETESDGSCGGMGEGAWGGAGEEGDDFKPADLDYDEYKPFEGKPNDTYDKEGPANVDTSGAGAWGLGGGGDGKEGGCKCNDNGKCDCPPFCDCKKAHGSCGSGKCGPGEKDPVAEGLQRQLTRFFTEARSIIKENARYGRRIIGAKLNESWDRSAGYCRITSSKQKVGQALSMLKNRYPRFNPLFENTQEVMKTGYMIDKGEGKKTEEGGKEPSMSDFTEVIGKGLNNRQPKNGLVGKPKEYPK